MPSAFPGSGFIKFCTVKSERMEHPKADLALLRELAKGKLDPRGFRGRTLPDLVTEAQGLKWWLDDEDFLGDAEQRKVYCETRLGAILKELQRRRRMRAIEPAKASQDTVRAIRESAPVADILENYTQVFYKSKDQFSFRCHKHGEDKHPSGVVYVKENRWFCYGCNVGGSVYDALQVYGDMSFPEALKYLSKYIGIDLELLPQKRQVKEVGVPKEYEGELHGIPENKGRPGMGQALRE